MKTGSLGDQPNGEILDESQVRTIREVVRAVRSVAFGSVEIVIRNSRIVQVERKEKIRFDHS
jgi:hypothetical protein